jgi:excinuclease ABC subunit A
METIRIRGARTHNLRNVSLDIPRNRLVVITGLSGSGKSSLAFDTLYAEGQRRYVESLSAYARQFLQLMEKPDVDLIEGLSPAIAIEQKASSHNPRSTVGTVTEIHDYLRLLFARVGDPYCPDHDKALSAQSVSQMVDHVCAMADGTRVMVLAPLVVGRKGEQVELFDELRAQGFVRLRIDGEVHEIDRLPKLDRNRKHTVEIVIDRVKIEGDRERPGGLKQRLAESFETALRHADGRAIAVELGEEGKSGREHLFSSKFACPVCSYSIPELEPRLFSFNNPMGACPRCDGLGEVTFFDPRRVVAFPHLSLAGGAVRGWDRRNQFYFAMLVSLAQHYGFDVEMPFESLPTRAQEAVLTGSGDEKIAFRYPGEKGRSAVKEHAFEGIIPNLERRYRETDSVAVKEELAKYLNTHACPECGGTRLRVEARNVRVAGRNIHELSSMPLRQSQPFFEGLELPGSKKAIAEKIVREIANRVLFLNNVASTTSRSRAPPTRSRAARRNASASRARSARAHGRDVRARRALDRPAPARQRAPHRHAEEPARPRQLGDRGGARRGGDHRSRPRGRHGARRRRARRRDRGPGDSRRDPAASRLAHRPVPVGRRSIPMPARRRRGDPRSACASPARAATT